jgi:hypothetical protein
MSFLKNRTSAQFGAIFTCALALLISSHRALATPADFSVTSPGFSYTINSMPNNPTLTLVRGKTYTFSVSTSAIHPFRINSAGVVNNNISSGTITYTVPLVASNYIYECSIHHFSGTILTVPASPPPPPTIRILGLSVGTNITLTSTGTDTWSVIPEFTTNLTTTNWFALTVQTNRYFTGTNETICGKPPGSPVLIRIRSQPKP